MRHQFDNLKICAFRQLKNLELNSLGRINLLVGMNNSGKTSVLEAIDLHCRPLDPLHWLDVARQREIKSSREPVLDAVRWLFPQENASEEDPYYRGELRIESTGDYANQQTTARYEGISGDPKNDEWLSIGDLVHDDEEAGTGREPLSPPSPPSSYDRGADIDVSARVSSHQWTEFDALQDGLCEEYFRLWENERFVSRTAPSKIRLPVAEVSPFAHRVRQFQVSQLSEVVLKGNKFSAIEALQLIDNDIQDLEILSRSGIRPTLYVRRKKTAFTPLNAMGDGIRRVLTIVLNLSSAQHGVLLVDEIETAIH